MAYDQHVRTPLVVIYEGWRNVACEGLAVYTWVEELCEHLETLRDVSVSNGLVESEKRKIKYDEGKADRVLEIGEKFLCRIPELIANLEDFWDRPFVVIQKLNTLNYFVEEIDGKKEKEVYAYK